MRVSQETEMRSGREPREPRRWVVEVTEEGGLRALLTGAEPSVEVTGDNLASLRRQVARLMVAGQRQAGRVRRPG